MKPKGANDGPLVRRGEWPVALLMALQFFLVITTFWILKPLKKGLWYDHYHGRAFDLVGWGLTGAEAEQLAKVLNMFAAYVAATLFTMLSRKLVRERITLVFNGLFVLGFLVFAAWFNAGSSEPSVWTFYVFGDMYNTVMLAAFFAFLNDSVTPDASKRLYGLIVFGGVAGGAFGSTIVSAFVGDLSLTTWLFVCTGTAAIVAVAAIFAGRRVRDHKLGEPPGAAATAPTASGAIGASRDERAPAPGESKAAGESPVPGESPAPGDSKAVASSRKSTGSASAAFEGARLVFGSRYLLAIVAMVALYELVSTIMDYQFSAAVAHYMGADAGDHFKRVFAFTNWVGMFLQLFVVSFVMRRLGMTVALLCLPAAASLGSLSFLAVPSLWTGSALNPADSAFNYSIQQSAREALYVPTSREEKYAAKAFIDMFVQRAAKVVAVGLNLSFGVVLAGFGSVRWLSVVALVFLGVWVAIAVYAGRAYEARSANVSPAT